MEKTKNTKSKKSDVKVKEWGGFTNAREALMFPLKDTLETLGSLLSREISNLHKPKHKRWSWFRSADEHNAHLRRMTLCYYRYLLNDGIKQLSEIIDTFHGEGE